MHELSICRGLLHEVEAVARRHSALRVVVVVLRIGPLAGVEPALLQEAFTLASGGSFASGAELVIERTAVRLACKECGNQGQAPSATRLRCPVCDSWRTEVLAGEELLLTRVELEVLRGPGCGHELGSAEKLARRQ